MFVGSSHEIQNAKTCKYSKTMKRKWFFQLCDQRSGNISDVSPFSVQTVGIMEAEEKEKEQQQEGDKDNDNDKDKDDDEDANDDEDEEEDPGEEQQDERDEDREDEEMDSASNSESEQTESDGEDMSPVCLTFRSRRKQLCTCDCVWNALERNCHTRIATREYKCRYGWK